MQVSQTEDTCDGVDDDCDSHVDMDSSTGEGLCDLGEVCTRPAVGSEDQPCLDDYFCVGPAAGEPGFCSGWCWNTYQECTPAGMSCDPFIDAAANAFGSDGVGRCLQVQDLGTAALGEACPTQVECESMWCFDFDETGSSPDPMCSDMCAMNDHCDPDGGWVCKYVGVGGPGFPIGSWDRGICGPDAGTGPTQENGQACDENTPCRWGACNGNPGTCIDLVCTSDECPANTPVGLYIAGDYDNSTVKLCDGTSTRGAGVDGVACTDDTDCSGNWCLQVDAGPPVVKVCADACCYDSDCDGNTTCELLSFGAGGETAIHTCIDVSLLGPPEPISTDIEVLWLHPMSTPLSKNLKVLDPDYGILEPEIEVWE